MRDLMFKGVSGHAGYVPVGQLPLADVIEWANATDAELWPAMEGDETPENVRERCRIELVIRSLPDGP
jgi:hypothetical protein